MEPTDWEHQGFTHAPGIDNLTNRQNYNSLNNIYDIK